MTWDSLVLQQSDALVKKLWILNFNCKCHKHPLPLKIIILRHNFPSYGNTAFSFWKNLSWSKSPLNIFSHWVKITRNLFSSGVYNLLYSTIKKIFKWDFDQKWSYQEVKVQRSPSCFQITFLELILNAAMSHGKKKIRYSYFSKIWIGKKVVNYFCCPNKIDRKAKDLVKVAKFFSRSLSRAAR